MKKIFILLFTLPIFAFSPFFVLANTSQLDQSYEELTGGGGPFFYLVDQSSQAIQTFKPTRGLITRVDVYLENRLAGSSAKVYLTGSKGTVLSGPYSHALSAGGSGWETYSIPAPYLSVTPGNTYGIKLSFNDMQTRWVYNRALGYSNGYFFPGGPSTDLDALFRIYTQEASSSSSPSGSTSSSSPSSTAANQAESESSDTAEALTPESQGSTDRGFLGGTSNLILYILSGLVVLLIGFLIVYELKYKNRKKHNLK